jgi:hypothetical protein
MVSGILLGGLLALLPLSRFMPFSRLSLIVPSSLLTPATPPLS